MTPIFSALFAEQDDETRALILKAGEVVELRGDLPAVFDDAFETADFEVPA